LHGSISQSSELTGSRPAIECFDFDAGNRP
jgi:hypothetical protein